MWAYWWKSYSNRKCNYLNAKPYISLKVATAGGTPSTGTTVGTIGTPGAMTITSMGSNFSVTAARGTVGTTNAFYILLHGLHHILSDQIMRLDVLFKEDQQQILRQIRLLDVIIIRQVSLFGFARVLVLHKMVIFMFIQFHKTFDNDLT